MADHLSLGYATVLPVTGFLLFDTLFTPNVIEQFTWLLATYFLFRMISENNPELWIVIGILLGVAFLNKYSVLFYIAGFLIAILFSSHRKFLNSRYFCYAIFIGIIIIFPNLVWQYLHG
jgi:4-amino-4-deoxy-L-arabinose transferase-like glycosyltransferase